MNSPTEFDLLRLLRGDLPAAEAQALRGRLAREPGLAAAYERLAAVWGTLEPPAPAPIPPGFSGRVMALAREEAGGGGLAWAQAPGWVRAAAAASLLAGAALGAGLGTGLGTGRPATPAAPPAPAEVIAAVPSPGAVVPLPSPAAIPPVGPAAAPAPPAIPVAPAPPGATEPGGREMEEIETFEEAGAVGEDDAFDEPGAASLAEGYWAAFGDDLGGDLGETLP